jgi:hypothetical protein
MEEVLQLYTSINNPRYPLVCFDEASKKLVKETRTPLAPEPGHPERYDSEYERNGTANLFICFAPLIGWRQVSVTDTRTAHDDAYQMKSLQRT